MSGNGPRLNRGDVAAVALLAVLTVMFFHSALIGGEQFFAGDTYRFFYPLKKMAADAVRAGQPPVWNPLVHSGMPLHAALQAAVYYPLSIPLYALPFDFAFKLYIALHVLIAAAGTYFLLRRWRLDHIPAAVAGVTYAFSGYVISFIDGLNIFSSIVWLPVVFGLFEYALEKPSFPRIALASFAVAAQTLVGDPVSGYCTFVICGAYWLITLVSSSLRRDPRRETLAIIAVLPIVAVLTFMLSYAQIAPSAELTLYSTRAEAITYETATQHSFAPLRLLSLIVPYIFGNPLENIYDWGRMFAPHFPLTRTFYVGALPLALMIIAMAGLKEKRVYFFMGVLVVTLLLSLGKFTPLYKLAYMAMPLLSKFRYPMKFFFAVSFSIAVLAGYGLQYLITENPNDRFQTRPIAAKFAERFSNILVIAGTAWLAFALCDRFLLGLSDPIFLRLSTADEALTTRFIPYIKQQMLLASVMFAMLGWLLWAWRKGLVPKSLFAVFALVFLLLDLPPSAYRAMRTIPESYYTAPAVDETLRNDPDYYRLYRTPLDVEQNVEGIGLKKPVDYYMWNRELLSPNYGTLFGHGYTDGYESANLLWHNLFIRLIETAPPIERPRLLGALNVKYIFSSKKIKHPDLRLKDSPAKHVFLYENMRCLDRAYFTSSSAIAPSEGAALKFMGSKAFDPYQMVVLVDKGGAGSLNPKQGIEGFEVAMPTDFTFASMNLPDAVETAAAPVVERGPNPVEILSYSPTSITLSVDAPSDGHVVLCDAYYPRWRARVNGQEVPVLRANCTVRAVEVPEGKSSIEFTYDTSLFKRSAFISLGALLFCLGGIAISLYWNGKRKEADTAAG